MATESWSIRGKHCVVRETGAGAINYSANISAACNVVNVSVAFDIAPVTEAPLWIIHIDGTDSVYDVVLRQVDPRGHTSIVYFPDNEWDLEKADSLQIMYSNPDARTFGARIAVRVL